MLSRIPSEIEPTEAAFDTNRERERARENNMILINRIFQRATALSIEGRNYLELARFELSPKCYLNFLVNDKSVGQAYKLC